MTVEELENQLKSNYDIKLFLDIGEVSVNPGSLFKILDNTYQAHYEPNDRIVFYTSHLLSEKFLCHLYETFNFIDISNWFVLICGPKELESSIKSCCEKFSQDPVPFSFLSVDLPSTASIENGFALPETMCAIPWTNLEIRSDGSITPCCMSNDINLGNIKNITLEKAFHGKEIKKLREELLSGKKPAACRACWKVEEKNLTSIRQHNIKRLKRDFLLKYVDSPQIATIDLKFNNTCNFKCRICSPGSSSLFAQEDHKFRGVPLIIQDNWSESPFFIDQICSNLHTIHNIDMYGGEPFLIKKFKEVLKLAVDRGYSENIRLHYNSNGSIWPDQFLPYWKSFKLVDIHFSIDAIGKQFELQRGGNWSEVENNILNLKNLGLPNLSISIMPTISVMNVYYIDQVYDWAKKHGFQIFVSHARGPGVELQNLTARAKQLIVEKFKNHPWTELQKIIEIIQKLPDSDGKDFLEKIKYFDKIRGEDFSVSHPEIAKAMGYV